MKEKRRILNELFYPKSVAIVGANNVKGTVPYDIVKNILKSDFNGIVYPVSPKEKSIAGVKAYKYIVDISDPVDLAILVFPSSVCHLAMEQLGEKGVKSAIIISAGFKEVGSEGIEREQRIKEIAAKYEIPFLGPNCLGIINTDPKINLNASFARRMPEQGEIGFLSQSGALCTAVLDYAWSQHIGFSKFVSFGNKADIDEVELLYYMAEDPKTSVILMYLEEIKNGRKLMDAALDITKNYKKPILAIKSGRTSQGASAAASHTGSLAGSDEVTDAAFRQSGIIRCTSIDEMFNKAIAFAYQPLPAKNRVAIITNAGGPGVLTTDAAVKSGLELAKFNDETLDVFRKNLPKTANINNPVDVIGDARADRYHVAVSNAMADDNVDGVFVILTPQSMTDIDTIAAEIVKGKPEYTKPIYTSFMGEADVRSGIDILLTNKIPHFTRPESMCESFAAVYNFTGFNGKHDMSEPDSPISVNRESAEKYLKEREEEAPAFITEEGAVKILKDYGLPVLENSVATSAKQAAEAAERIGFPVVMKVISKDIVHKSDVGGVVLNITSAEESEKSFKKIAESVKEKMPDSVMEGVFISRMAEKGKEVIIGLKRDPGFGPVVMFGLGGIYVELFKDVQFRVAPVKTDEALSMIKSIKAYPILKGIRGEAPSDIESTAKAICAVSQLALDFPEISELDINPMIVYRQGRGCSVADAKIMMNWKGKVK